MGPGPLEIDGVGLFIYGIDEPVLIGKTVGIATQEIHHQLLAVIGILSNGFSEDCIAFFLSLGESVSMSFLACRVTRIV
jgi:hypothetical protein